MSIEIDVAGTTDAPELAALHYLSHTTSFAQFASPAWVKSRRLDDYLRQWQEFLSGAVTGPGAQAWKATIDGDGVLAGMVRVSAVSERVAQLSSMHVHPDRHRRGIGALLMDAAVSFMRDAGFETATLGVIQANTAARTLYERGGWQVSELRPTGVEGVPVAVYSLSLSI